MRSLAFACTVCLKFKRAVNGRRLDEDGGVHVSVVGGGGGGARAVISDATHSTTSLPYISDNEQLINSRLPWLWRESGAPPAWLPAAASHRHYPCPALAWIGRNSKTRAEAEYRLTAGRRRRRVSLWREWGRFTAPGSTYLWFLHNWSGSMVKWVRYDRPLSWTDIL